MTSLKWRKLLESSDEFLCSHFCLFHTHFLECLLDELVSVSILTDFANHLLVLELDREHGCEENLGLSEASE